MDQSAHLRSDSEGQATNAGHIDTPRTYAGLQRGVSWIRNAGPSSTMATARIARCRLRADNQFRPI